MSAFAAPTNNNPNPRSEFESQRAELVREIALGMDSVLQYINRLNRNLESIIAVGNEFSSVEALWSQFENVMGTTEEGLQQQQQQQQQSQSEQRQADNGDGEDGEGEEAVDVKREDEDEDGVDLDNGHRG